MQLLDAEALPLLDESRLKLLKWTLSETLANVDLKDIPVPYLRNVLTLYLMIEEKFISRNEADMILLTVLNVERDTIPEKMDYPPVLNERAFRLVFLYYRIWSVVGRSIKTVGLRRLCEPPNFDGVFFHKLFLEFNQSGINPSDSLGEIDHLRIYKDL